MLCLQSVRLAACVYNIVNRHVSGHTVRSAGKLFLMFLDVLFRYLCPAECLRDLEHAVYPTCVDQMDRCMDGWKDGSFWWLPSNLSGKISGLILQDSRERVLIKFERSKHSRKGKVQSQMQETPLYDVIDYEDGRWQPLAPGDRVLAPWKKKSQRYGPGVILQVDEVASSHSGIIC